MNITPATIKSANVMPTNIAVYDTEQKKAVLLFKSIHLCITYLFWHRISKDTDRSKFRGLILRCCQKKQKEDLNCFSATFTYRYANDTQKEQLAGNDYIVLDNKYISEKHELTQQRRNGGVVYSYELEKILQKGDTVEIIAGKLTGYTTRILEVKGKSASTPGNRLYVLKIPGGKYDFKANVLNLVEKHQPTKDAGIGIIK